MGLLDRSSLPIRRDRLYLPFGTFHPEADRLAADVTVLDVSLLLFGRVNERREHFTAVRALNIHFPGIDHALCRLILY